MISAKIETFTPSNVRYSNNISEHFEIIKKEFYGKSELSYTVGKLIVAIRRNISLTENLDAFFFITKNHSSHLASELNLRWIVSIMDTIADHGGQNEASSAVLISSLVNMVKLAETEKKYFYKLQENPEIDNEGYKTELFDGLTFFNLITGDMPYNLFARIRKNIAAIPYLNDYYVEVEKRLINNNNFLNHLNSINNRFV